MTQALKYANAIVYTAWLSASEDEMEYPYYLIGRSVESSKTVDQFSA